LPVLVLAELLGVPPEMRDEFREWASVITDDLGTDSSSDTPLGRGYDMFRYFYTEIRRRRTQPNDDLLSVVAATDAAGLSDHEVMAFCAFLLVAGIETTTNLFTNIVDTVVTRPSSSNVSGANRPGGRGRGGGPALRHVGAGTVASDRHRRRAGRGRAAGRGKAAGPLRFGQPRRRGLRRSGHLPSRTLGEPHLAFGSGHHRCLGATLAKVELVAASRRWSGPPVAWSPGTVRAAEQPGIARIHRPTGDRMAEVRSIPASVAQRLLWVLEQHRGRHGSANCPIVLRLRGPLDRSRLSDGLTALTARHESLRTTFAGRGTRLTQVVHDAAPVRLRCEDLCSDDPERALREAVTREVRQPVDAERWPTRVTLFRLGEQDHGLCVNLHHAVTDGGSAGSWCATSSRSPVPVRRCRRCAGSTSSSASGRTSGWRAPT
jgi:hypothetical protein